MFVDAGRTTVCAVVPLQCNWLQILGNYRLVEMQARVASQGEMIEERTCSIFGKKVCTRSPVTGSSFVAMAIVFDL